jgi:hypothetical protein
MSDQPYTDGVDFSDEIPDLEESLGEDGEDEVAGRSWSPPDAPSSVFRHGVTAEEEHEGALLEDRLAAELPDLGHDRFGRLTEDDESVGGEVGDERAGRLVAPDQGAHADEDKDLYADDIGIDEGAAGAEEAAVHVVHDED